MNKLLSSASSGGRRTFRRLGWLGEVLENPLGLAGFIIIALMVFAALFAGYIAPYDYAEQDVLRRLEGPSEDYLLGTDHLGRDLFSRTVYGTGIALQVALPAMGISLVAGVLLGLLAGYFGGYLDYLILLVLDALQSLPSIILALVILSLLGPSKLNLIIVIGITFFPGYARVVRAQALAARQNVYIDAEKSLGASPVRIIFLHILPNIIPPVIILATMDLPAVITMEAGLSFLGLGVSPPTPSWGVILSEGFYYFRQSPWPIICAGSALAISTFGFTVFGETLRDVLDPRLAGTRKV